MTSRTRQYCVRAAACVGGLMVLGTMTMTPTTSSFYYDLETIQGSMQAGEWQVAPLGCGEPFRKKNKPPQIIEGDDQDNTLASPDNRHGNFPQVIFGYAGNDTLLGGNQLDCLVGGLGTDTLTAKSDDKSDENGKDVLLGGEGNDTLRSGNGGDYLNGGPGLEDVCIGENGPDTILNCEFDGEGNRLDEFGKVITSAGDQGTSSTGEKTLIQDVEELPQGEGGTGEQLVTNEQEQPGQQETPATIEQTPVEPAESEGSVPQEPTSGDSNDTSETLDSEGASIGSVGEPTERVANSEEDEE